MVNADVFLAEELESESQGYERVLLSISGDHAC